MKTIDLKISLDDLIQLENHIFYYNFESNVIRDIHSNGEILLEKTDKFSFDSSNIYIIKNGEIQVYNSKLTLIDKIINEGIQPGVSIIIYYQRNQYVITNQIYNRKTKSLDKLVLIRKEDYQGGWKEFKGIFLHNGNRLEYNDVQIEKSNSLTCYDLIKRDKIWKYSFKEQLNTNYIKSWNDLLFFVRQNDKKLHLVFININSGRLVWEIEVENGNMILDEKLGRLISLWGTNSTGLRYQIIDINNKTIETGKILDFEVENVLPFEHVQFISDKYVYFVDNALSHKDEQLKSPKIGCFDLSINKLIKFEDFPVCIELCSQIVFKGKKLYIKSSDNKLYSAEL